jgi:hypothetical protein
MRIAAAAVIDSDGHRFPCLTTADLAEAVRSADADDPASVLIVEPERMERQFALAGEADPAALDLYGRVAGNMRRLYLLSCPNR